MLSLTDQVLLEENLVFLKEKNGLRKLWLLESTNNNNSVEKQH